MADGRPPWDHVRGLEERTAARLARMPPEAKFDELRDYKVRVFQGIVHTPEYRARMIALEAEYDQWQRQQQTERGE